MSDDFEKDDKSEYPDDPCNDGFQARKSEPSYYSQPNNSAPPYGAYGYSAPNAPVNGEYAYSQPNRKKKKDRSGKKTVILALCCALIGGIIGACAVAAIAGLFGSGSANGNETVIYQSNRELSAVTTAQVKTGKAMTASELYAQNVNSTVGITTQITTNFWGFTSTSAASGSGFIISEDGYIVTNHHVIEGANSITVSTYDEREFEATLVGYDSSNDLAVLKIDAEGLTPVVMGSSAKMNVGDDVVAIGNPLGELTFSLTKGTVSALDRNVTISSGVSMKLIQTDCAINSGNSGGALFNMFGEVIGITNAKYSSSSSGTSIDNIGFAIPIDHVKPLIESIIEKGYVSTPFIGVTIQNVSDDAIAYGAPDGAAIKGVEPDSPAEKAGILVNDIITAADGQEISSDEELIAIIRSKEIGEKVVLKLFRQGQTLEVTVTVGEKISTEEPETQSEQQQQQNPGFMFPWGSFFGF